MKFLTILLSLSLSSVFASNNLSHIVSILKQVESLGDTKAVGDGGKAYGVLQIHKVYVKEVNNRYGTTYTHEEMFDEICAEEVFYLYMRYASRRFKKLYKRSPTEEEVVRMHNGGMYQGHKIGATVKYYKKYLEFEKIMEQDKNKILSCIDSCENPQQLFSVNNMINTFVKQYACQSSREELSQAYRDKYKELD